MDVLNGCIGVLSLLQVMDGRRHTGGRVEVKVRLREPLSGQDVQTSTERWLLIDSSPVRSEPIGQVIVYVVIKNRKLEKTHLFSSLGPRLDVAST